MIKCFFVDVKSIKSSLPRANFIESELEQLADLILEVDGLLRPLILQETGAGKYKVIEGHREYYAAVRAKEKNLAKAEMVNAFVIDDSNRKSAIAQLALLSGEPAVNVSDKTDDRLSLKRVESIVEAKISQQLQPILEQLAQHDKILDTLTSAEPLLPVLEAKISQQIQPILDRLTKHDEILDILNSDRSSQTESAATTIEPIPHNQTARSSITSSSIRSGEALPIQPEQTTAPKKTTKSTISKKAATTSDIPLPSIPSDEALAKQPEPEVATPKNTTKSTTRNKIAKTSDIPASPVVSNLEPPKQPEPQELAAVKTSKSIANSKTSSNFLSSIDPTKATNTLNLINTLNQQQLTVSMERSGLKTSVKFIPNLIDYRNSQPDRQIESWEMILDAKYIGLKEAAIKKIIDKLK
ncbi:ParB N-terminal domain-containing protein [Chamaesiphon minutus]|uniref:ParB-like nuclease n=1 Tax=Chamaesiphon minutus (strain ATCC 27169 / PCC 6605) TaxID=1173020 RepID=K9UB03_CHAP6|nr:ParB N-terminal domain-containing protein [Chamaesiphon minutus]AFY91399.1 ParB-like nuclease [Chamaesiphon minutus PCC 6605]